MPASAHVKWRWWIAAAVAFGTALLAVTIVWSKPRLESPITVSYAGRHGTSTLFRTQPVPTFVLTNPTPKPLSVVISTVEFRDGTNWVYWTTLQDSFTLEPHAEERVPICFPKGFPQKQEPTNPWRIRGTSGEIIRGSDPLLARLMALPDRLWLRYRHGIGNVSLNPFMSQNAAWSVHHAQVLGPIVEPE